MNFITDKQTLDDLNIFGKRGSSSIYSLFNQSHTYGGAKALDEMFRYPLSDKKEINKRSSIIRYFGKISKEFPFQSILFENAEQYLGNTDKRSILTVEQNTLGRKFNTLIGSDTEYRSISKGVSSIIEIIQIFIQFIDELEKGENDNPYKENIDKIKKIIFDPNLDILVQEKYFNKLGFEKIAKYDRLMRGDIIVLLKRALSFIYELDVFMSVAKIAKEKNFVFPEAIDDDISGGIFLKEAYHPLVPNAVPNSINITSEDNIVFLTGANMAGKSTLMKTLGIAVFLAHMGFPVPAQSMKFSVLDGIYTTINLPDDINMGYSHFYAEVLRVKKVAWLIGKSKRLFVLFDELFRGTNVKDAYEATVAITSGIAQRRNCFFVVSTHIMEAGEKLRERHPNINFVYMPTLMDDDNRPVYPYRLESGVTSDRYGMVIINNEGIIDIIQSRTK